MKRKNKRVNWTQEPPTEQAWYWHWNGNLDDAPFIYSVMVSGTAGGRCFVQSYERASGDPQQHSLWCRWCEDIGGWWLKIPPPELPEVRD
jgi:hypothetical protein